MQVEVAVIGSGIAGLVCAQQLAKHGIRVTVFEQARGPGGRMSRKRATVKNGLDTVDVSFDHGALFISTPKSDQFKTLMQGWMSTGLVEPWNGRFVVLDAARNSIVPEVDEPARFTGMNRICKHLATTSLVESQYETKVARSRWNATNKTWSLFDDKERSLGEYSAVIAADRLIAKVGGPAQVVIEGEGTDILTRDVFDKLRSVESIPAFALMVAFAAPLTTVPFDSARVVNSIRIGRITRDSSKPTQQHPRGLDCWVITSTPEYAASQIATKAPTQQSQTFTPSPPQALDEITEDIMTELRALLQPVAGNIPEPIFKQVHRWGSAFPKSALAPLDGCLINPSLRFAACGDYCLGADIESAALSGFAAANIIKSCL